MKKIETKEVSKWAEDRNYISFAFLCPFFLIFLQIDI